MIYRQIPLPIAVPLSLFLDSGAGSYPEVRLDHRLVVMLPGGQSACRVRALGKAAVMALAGVGSLTAFTSTASAQPQIYTVGVVVTDRVDAAVLPAHMRSQHPVLVRHLDRDVRSAIAAVGRFRTRRLPPLPEGEHSDPAAQSVDFIVRVALNKAHKVYTNEILHNTRGGLSDDAVRERAGGSPREVVSLPSLTAEVEVRLVDPHRDHILWSATRENTVVVPHDKRLFIYNAWKYPGSSDPGVVGAFLADILRLQQTSRWVDRALGVSDRWFISRPGDDLRAIRDLLRELALSFGTDIDDNLPLEGRIQAMVTGAESEGEILLNIGEQHGLVPRLRLDLWPPRHAQRKVGQIEVVSVDSTTAVARLRKLDRKLKNSGEDLHGYRVISRKRTSRR